MHIQKLYNLLTKRDPKCLLFYKLKTQVIHNKLIHKHAPFIEYYEKQTGERLSEKKLIAFKKKHPNILGLSEDGLQASLQVLSKFNIDESAACAEPHVFSMNPVCVDNYGEILKECGFLQILPIHIIRYHTLVKSNTIQQLKKKGLLAASLKVPQKILETFSEWPNKHKINEKFDESTTNIVNIRMHILQKYLNWKLSVTSEEFEKYCRNYLPFRHKPMIDVQEAINLAQNEIKFDVTTIRRNGFIISADPVNTKILLENMETIAGLDIREAMRKEPGIMKNTYDSLLEIENILEEHGIAAAARQRCLRVFCLSPRAVRARLAELRALKEYQVLATNPRVLMLVVHKRKMQARLGRIEAANKQCFSLNHLVASSKIFNDYIGSFGNKTCSRDVAVLIHQSLVGTPATPTTPATPAIPGTPGTAVATTARDVARQLSRHKYWLHTALGVIDANLRWLRARFAAEDILLNCQLLLYPRSEIQHYVDSLRRVRGDGGGGGDGGVGDERAPLAALDVSYGALDGAALSDAQLLSLALYEVERRYHFTGDGIWPRQDRTEVTTGEGGAR